MSFLTGLAGGFADSYANKKAKDDREAARAKEDAMLARYEALAGAGAAPSPGASGGTAGGMGAPGPRRTSSDGTLLGYLDSTEGGGDYRTLFGHAQNGGRFAGVDITKMSLGDLYKFTDPNGEYGQWVKANNPQGVVATPLGRGQIVGTTLRATAQAMGLPDTTVFSPDVQNQMIARLAQGRLKSADTMAGKIAGLRNEWSGFAGVPDDELSAAISKFEQTGGQLMPRPMGATRRPI